MGAQRQERRSRPRPLLSGRMCGCGDTVSGKLCRLRMRLSLLANRRAARLRTRSRKYPSVTRTVQSAAPAPIAWVVPVGAGAVSRFALFAAANETTERLLRDHGDLLERSVRAPAHSGRMWLVRLDGYTACVAKHENEGVAAGFLQNLKASARCATVCGLGLIAWRWCIRRVA